MRRSAIILARVLGYIEVFDLNAKGNVYLPDLVNEIAKKYQFKKFPIDLEEQNLAKGVEFLQGRSGDRVISRLVLWEAVIVVETQVSTDESKALLEELLDWAALKFGLAYSAGAIKRFAYISDLTFYSDAPILAINSAAAKIASRVSKELSTIWQEPIKYEALSFKVGHDPLSRKVQIAPFSIERRVDTKFSDNKYFSEAPLPTKLHLELLEQFERDMLMP